MTEQINWHPNGTPGPWKAEPEARDETVLVIFPDGEDDPWSVCECFSYAANGEVSVNARAIAEIPAMVVALRKVAKMIDFDGWAFSNEIRAILARIDGEA